jgi:hypothetical protein
MWVNAPSCPQTEGRELGSRSCLLPGYFKLVPPSVPRAIPQSYGFYRHEKRPRHPRIQTIRLGEGLLHKLPRENHQDRREHCCWFAEQSGYRCIVPLSIVASQKVRSRLDEHVTSASINSIKQIGTFASLAARSAYK